MRPCSFPTLPMVAALALGLGACADDSTGPAPFDGDDPLDPPLPDDDLVDAPRSMAAECPAGDPACEGPFDVVISEYSFVLGTAPESVTLCGDLPHAVAHAFDGNGGVLSAEVFIPQSLGSWPPGTVPLVLLGPGNNLDYDEYDGILEHLASQGMLTASVGMPLAATVSRRSELMQCVLRHIVADTELGAHVDPSQIVLAGHSRGGEGAVMVANRLTTSTHTIDMSLDVPAVVAIAPSAQCIKNGNACGFTHADGVPLTDPEKQALIDLTRLSDAATKSLLVLQGSRDHDVDGEGLTIYDLASTEFPPAGTAYMRKSMLWAFDVPHAHWGGGNGGTSTRAATIANSYITGFLRWNLDGDHDYAPHFQSNRQPPFCVAWPAACGHAFERPPVYTEYVEGTHDGGSRKVIHDFEVDWDPRIPGTLSPLVGGTSVALYPDPGTRETVALAMQWNAAATTVSIELDDVLDVERYDVLSLRAGILPDLVTPCVTPPPSFDLAIRLESDTMGMTASHEVLASTYAHLSHPDCGAGMVGPMLHAQTIRVPLRDFEGVDLQMIRKLEVRVDDSMGESVGAMFIDGVELVDNAVYCGNDEIEGSESCDGEDLAGNTCADFGYFGGQLSCSEGCRFDTELCNDCGNGVLDPGETCEDGIFPAGLDCDDFGYAQGDLSCEASCTVIGTATCSGGVAINSPGSYAACLSAAEREDCELLGPAGCAKAYGDRDCLGGPCRPTQPGDVSLGSLLDFHNENGGEFHPDGTYRDGNGDLYYCMDVGNERRVCADDDGWGVCRRCDATDGADNTKLGCPCAEEDDCVSFNASDPAMACWGEEFGPGQGTCWDIGDGPPSWQCAASSCGQAPYWGDDVMFCEHYASEARCEPAYACSGPESIICADSEMVCDPNDNGCTNECQVDAHCAEALGWPAGYCCLSDQCQPGVC